MASERGFGTNGWYSEIRCIYIHTYIFIYIYTHIYTYSCGAPTRTHDTYRYIRRALLTRTAQERRNRTLALHEPVHGHILVLAGSQSSFSEVTEYKCITLLQASPELDNEKCLKYYTTASDYCTRSGVCETYYYILLHVCSATVRLFRP